MPPVRITLKSVRRSQPGAAERAGLMVALQDFLSDAHGIANEVIAADRLLTMLQNPGHVPSLCTLLKREFDIRNQGGRSA